MICVTQMIAVGTRVMKEKFICSMSQNKVVQAMTVGPKLEYRLSKGQYRAKVLHESSVDNALALQ